MPTTFSGILLACSLLLTPQTSWRVADIISIGDVFFLAAVLFGLLERLLLKEIFPILPVYLVAALLLTLSYLVNLGIPNAEHDSYFFITIINAVLVPSGLLMVRMRSLSEMQGILYFWLAGTVFGAGYAYAYTLGLVPWHSEYYWLKLYRLQGLTPHPNVLAINAAIATPLALLMFVNHRALILKGVALGILLLLFLTMDKTGSRAGTGAMLAMFLTFMGLVFMTAPAGTKLRFFVLLCSVALALVMVLFFADFEFRPRSALARMANSGNLSSDTVRDYKGTHGVQGFMSAPIFGQGFHLMRFAHNIYLQALQSLGVVGFIGYISTFMFPLYLLVTAPARGQERNLQIALTSLIAGLLAAAWFWSSYTDLNISVAFALTLYAGYMLHAKHPGRRKKAGRNTQPATGQYRSA